ETPAPRPMRGRRLTVAAIAAFAVFAVVPLAVVAAVPPLHDLGTTAVRVNQSEVPVTSRVTPSASVQGGAVHLDSKRDKPSPAAVFYTVLRAKGANKGLGCAGLQNNAADDCRLFMDTAGTTHTTSLVDHPGKGDWTYRIGVSANWLNDVTLGDVYVVGRPITVSVP